MVPDPRRQRRVYLTIAPGLDGRVELQASHVQPSAGVAAMVLNVRGNLASDPMTIPLLSVLPAPAVVEAGTVTIRQKATAALAAGARELVLDAPGIVQGVIYQVLPTAPPPAPYQVQPHGWGVAPGKLLVRLSAPFLAIGADYAIPCRLVRLA